MSALPSIHRRVLQVDVLTTLPLWVMAIWLRDPLILLSIGLLSAVVPALTVARILRHDRALFAQLSSEPVEARRLAERMKCREMAEAARAVSRLLDARTRELERRNGIAFENHPLPMWLYDADTLNIVDVNSAATEKYGYSREAFLKRSLLDLRLPEDAGAVRAHVLDVKLRDAPDCSRWRHVTAAGEQIIVDVYGRKLAGDANLRMICVVDRTVEHGAIKEVRAAKARLEATVAERTAALAESEALYRTLAELSPQIIWQASPEGNVTYVNPAWHALVGEREGGWLGREWENALHPDDIAKANNAFKRSTDQKEPFRVRVRVRARDGDYRILQAVAAPVLGGDGQVTGWVGVDTDITDLVRHVVRLRQLNNDLDAVSYTVSHDLRAPVQVIRGFTDGILRGQIGRIDEAGRTYLERVHRNATRMDELITDLLTLSRISRQTLRYERFDPVALARETLELVQDRYPDRPIALHAKGNIEIHADRRLVRVILENLFDNAAKFSVESMAVCVELTACLENDEVLLAVADRGVGFPEERASRLFRPFQRLHSDARFQGTGVGLATVARIAQLHGGSIHGRNREGGGAHFELRIPRDVLPAPRTLSMEAQ